MAPLVKGLRAWLLGLGLTIVFALPMSGFAWATNQTHQATIRSDIQYILQCMADDLVQAIELTQRERIGDSKLLAGRSRLHANSAAELANLADSYVQAYDAYDLVLFAGARDGRILATNRRGRNGEVLHYDALVGRTLADQTWFANSVATGSPDVTYLPHADIPLLREVYGHAMIAACYAVPIRADDGAATQLCVLYASIEHTLQQQVDATVARLRQIGLTDCTLEIIGPNGTLVDRDLRELASRQAPAAGVGSTSSMSRPMLRGSALLPLLEVRIATDEQAVVHARAAALQRQLLLLVGCGFIACAGMAFLAVRYRAEKNRVQGLLRSQHDAAAAAVQAKGKMLSIMSHELRTPLSGMLGISDLLAETPLTSEQSELLRTLQQAGRNLRDLIDNALDHERLSASRMPFESLPVDWRHKLHQVERLMRPAFAQAHVGLSCTVDDAVPAAVLGDPLRTRQVLLNLLGNALRFTPRDGLVHVHVRLTDGGRTLRCSVADTGPGIPLDRQAAIFEPFTQADKTVARQFGGTGLGLTICRLIITGLGGRIGVDSQVGRGSTFWFELPATPAAPSAPQRGDTTSLTGARPLGLRVLVAEDDAISAFTVTHMLDKLGCTCLRVENGSEAVQAAATGTYDVILLDVQMPVMDGHAAARAIRAAESGRRTPILALSAATEAEDRTAAQAAGMDALVAKPITLAELRAALRRTQPA